MEKLEYFNYLRTIPALNFIGEADHPEHLEDNLYGIFQCFMPDGTGVEAVFSPLPDGDLLRERILPVYKLVEQKVRECLKQGIVPGYFVPETIVCSDEELMQLGDQFINNIKTLSEYNNDNEFTELMAGITNVEIVKSREELDKSIDDTQDYIYDALSDYISDYIDSNDLLSILSEAYYSIACDYWLSYYLQYPAIKTDLNCDIFKPYFELWARGYYCSFKTDALLICP